MLHSHLKDSTTIEPTTANAIFRTTSSSRRTTRIPQLAPSKVECIHSSASSKLRQESSRKDLDLRHLLGHIGLLESTGDELDNIRRRPSRNISTARTSRSSSRSRSSKAQKLPTEEVKVTEVEIEDEDYANLPPPPPYSETATEYVDDYYDDESDSSESSDSDSSDDEDEDEEDAVEVIDYENDVEHTLLRAISHHSLPQPLVEVKPI